MNNLYFLDYNTYGNRLVKKEDSLSDYLLYEVHRQTRVYGFNPNDGVDTTFTPNNNNAQVGNYVIVTDSLDNIVSRWFVMEARYTRDGQHIVKLHRDLMVDYWNGIKTAPCFIEKATVQPTDSAIFNKENMTFNQIKTSETPLKDETGCAWVVGYIPTDALSNKQVNGSVILEHAYDYQYNSLSDFPLNDIIGQDYYGKPYDIQYVTNIVYNEDNINKNCMVSYQYGNGNIRLSYPEGGITSTLRSNYTPSSNSSKFSSIYSLFSPMMNYPIGLISNYTNYTGNNLSKPPLEQIAFYENKIIYVNGVYYRVNFSQKSTNLLGDNYINPDSALGASWNGNLFKNDLSSTTPNNSSFELIYKYDVYVLSLEQIFTNAHVTINDTRYHLEDQPYDMFCIPYSDDLVIYQNGTQILTANKSIAVNMAIAIGKEAGTSSVYDVQLLPYCPVRYMIKSDGTFDISNSRVHYIKDSNDQNIGVICWATSSAFTIDIPYTITVDDVKISNECDVYRLSSPNFNGQFEFSAAKNGGVTSFNVDCNYKPFNPYIHINPNFGRLYGQDFNDARGLICGGDFSLPQLSNAWSNYELQNKNYQNIFDRQIQNMEVNNAINNVKGVVGALGNAIGTGAASGNFALGAGMGVAGALDLGLQIAQQQETLDYTKDLFGYQLGNIQALPTSLTKTTAFTYNNKIFPILEYYTCTEEEKQALRDKITYNGMTVMRIGKIEDYLQPEISYIKGQLIRLQVDEDNHLLEAIRQEVNKGVYV